MIFIILLFTLYSKLTHFRCRVKRGIYWFFEAAICMCVSIFQADIQVENVRSYTILDPRSCLSFLDLNVIFQNLPYLFQNLGITTKKNKSNTQ